MVYQGYVYWYTETYRPVARLLASNRQSNHFVVCGELLSRYPIMLLARIMGNE